MPTPKIKDAELRAVLAALETDLNTAFEAAKPGLLAKADDGDKKDGPPSESTDDSASPPADDGASAGGPPPPAASAAPASPSPAPDASMGAPPAGAPPAGSPAPAGDPAAEASLTPEALQAEYSQLSPEELDMHLQAAMAAKQALAASAAPAGAPPAGPAASPAPASPAGGMPPPALKAEHGETGTGGTPSTHPKANGGQEREVKKSEPDYQALLAQVATLQKSLDEAKAAAAATEKTYAEDVQNLTKAVTLVLERPERKAVTGISQIEYIRKSETAPEVKKSFTPAEAKAKLTELIPVLTKNERDLLVRVSTGQAKFEELQPVLDKHLSK